MSLQSCFINSGFVCLFFSELLKLPKGYYICSDMIIIGNCIFGSSLRGALTRVIEKTDNRFMQAQEKYLWGPQHLITVMQS